jgi:glycosyltransferase involved in cell wall biosynthesis
MTKVSIVTPCFNSTQFINRTVNSVQTQTLEDWEYIIVDDGSTDNLHSALAKCLDCNTKIKYIQQSNLGVANARNRGFRESTRDSQYLLFLDQDDCLEPNMLSIMVQYLEDNARVGLVHCDRTYVDENDQPLPYEYYPRYGFCFAKMMARELPDDCIETHFSAVFTLAPIVPAVSLIRRSVYEQTPGWDENFGQNCEDTDLFLHIALRSKVAFIARRLVRYRRCNQQASNDRSEYFRQERKLYKKWLSLENITSDQKKVIYSAWHFRQSKVISYIFFKTANQYFKQGDMLKSLRCYAIALKCYLFPSLSLD